MHLRTTLALAVLLPFVAANVTRLSLRVQEQRARHAVVHVDPVTTRERFLASVAVHLPSRGRVGYVRPNHSWTNADDMAALFQTAYSLAPRVVVYGATAEFVIGFPSGNVRPDAPEGYVQVRDFGGGVKLFRRMGQ